MSKHCDERAKACYGITVSRYRPRSTEGLKLVARGSPGLSCEIMRLAQMYVSALTLIRPQSSVLALNGSILRSTQMTSWCLQMSLCVCCPDVMLGEYTNQSSPSFDVHPGNMWFLYFLLRYLRLVACGYRTVKRSLCVTEPSVKIGRWVELNPSGSSRSMSQSAWKIHNVI